MKTNVIALLLLVALPAVAASAESPALSLEQLAEGVFAIQPTAAGMKEYRAVSNSGAIVLDDGVLIYDVHWTPEIAKQARQLLRAHTDKPIRYVVASHFHGDHTGGFWAYGDVERITHHATRKRLAEDAVGLQAELRQQVTGIEKQIADLPDGDQRTRMVNVLEHNRNLLQHVERDGAAPLPTLTFESRVELHRGRKVEIYFLGRGHTDGDAIVYLPEDKIAFLGDLLFTRTLPNVADGFTQDWIATLEQVLELGAERFVPGHGAVAGSAEVQAQIEYLKWLRGAVEPFVKEGKTVDEAKAAIELPAKYADYEFAFFLPASVEKVFAELTAGR